MSDSMVIYYKHRDWHLYRVVLQKGEKGKGTGNLDYYKVISSSRYEKNSPLDDPQHQNIDYVNYDNYYTYSDIHQKKPRNFLYLELEKKETTESNVETESLEETDTPSETPTGKKSESGSKSSSLRIDAESFYEKVDMQGKKPIVISSIAEYIDWITEYKVVSLFANCEVVLKQFVDKLKFFPQAETVFYTQALESLIKKANTYREEILNSMPDKTYSPEQLESKISDFIKKLRKTEKEAKNEMNTPTTKEGFKATADQHPIYRIMGEAFRAVNHVINLYRRNDYSMYYRGVGHIIYPEMPSVFRKNRKFEEDRQYKSMIMSFPKEFIGLSYLDRLAKLQHFGLPTRLLDVSSNPLVALYMACNTIYTGDKNQEDWGEVILYFMAGVKERAYDSKSVLINAALTKIPYGEKTNMYQFIRIHEVYIEKEYSKSNDPQLKNLLKETLNRCIHLASDYGSDTILPAGDAEALRNLISEVQAKKASIAAASAGLPTANGTSAVHMPVAPDAKTACDFCWYCMKDIKWPHNGRNWRSIGIADNANFDEDVEEKNYRWLFNEFANAYADLLTTIRRESPAFQNKIDIIRLLRCYHGNIGMTNERILAQSGSFIISGLDNMYINRHMISTRSDDYVRMIIKDKKKITDQLHLMNVTDATMLPDLNHKADYILKQIDKTKN